MRRRYGRPGYLVALLTSDDIQSTLNIDLTDPNGQDTATTLIVSATAWLARAIGYPIEEATVTEYFDGAHQLFFLPTNAPVSNLVLDSYNPLTKVYDPVDPTYIRQMGDSEVYSSLRFYCGYRAVKATYTTGWTAGTLPADLKQALIELVGLKLQQIGNFSGLDPTSASNETPILGALKRTHSDTYMEDYSTAQYDEFWKAKAAQMARSIGDSPPDGVMEVVRSYRRSFAI